MRYKELDQGDHSRLDPVNRSIEWTKDGSWYCARHLPTGQTIVQISQGDSLYARVQLSVRMASNLDNRCVPAINHCVGPDLKITTHKNRWWIRDTTTGKRWPFYNHMSLQHPATSVDRWVPRDPINTPDPAGVPKVWRQMVKAWAASPNHYGQCALCLTLTEDREIVAFTLDDGAHERQHLMEHLLSKTLPREFLYAIVHKHIRDQKMDADLGYLTPFEAATYTVAVTYAYNLLRSTNGSSE